jgi:hypothetical protein
MPVKRHGAGAKVPHERTSSRAQYATDLSQARLRVSPVVHRQCSAFESRFKQPHDLELVP